MRRELHCSSDSWHQEEAKAQFKVSFSVILVMKLSVCVVEANVDKVCNKSEEQSVPLESLRLTIEGKRKRKEIANKIVNIYCYKEYGRNETYCDTYDIIYESTTKCCSTRLFIEGKQKREGIANRKVKIHRYKEYETYCGTYDII
jgi:hypothetical protein